MTSSSDSFTIDPRFCGPPRSGNGGYVCGRLASGLGSEVRVRLKAPPPIGAPLRIVPTEAGARLLDGETAIAEAMRGAIALAVPACPSLAEAEHARSRYLGFEEHNFPTCFVCGPQRRPGDGLCLFPGALDAESSVLAAPWTPDASLADENGRVRDEFAWAALDCPGAFTRYPLAPGVALVLGELGVRLYDGEALAAGEPCIVIAWPLADEGRRRHAGTALYRADGRLVAAAHAIWIEVPARSWA
jgi:hypothetical protein